MSTILGSAAVVLAGIGIALAIALISVTTTMHRATRVVHHSVESIRVVEGVEAELLGESSDWATRRQRDATGDGGERWERDIVRGLAEAHGYVDSPEEARILADAEQKVEVYLARIRSFDPQHPSAARRATETSREFEAALTSLARLVEINVSQARESADLIAQWDKRSDDVGVVAIASFVAGASALIAGAQWLIRRPLLAIQQAIARYGAGDRGSRAPPTGPRELTDIAQTFNETADLLERQREAQFAFLGGVSHDLKTPLTALRMSIGVLAPDQPLPPEPSLRRTMALVSRQVDRLDRMVGDLLDASRIEAGKLDLRPEERDLRDLVRGVADLYGPAAPEHEIALGLPEAPVTVCCDATRIEQVLGNLVSNAIKYSPGGGRIEVAISSRGTEAEIAVRDHGIGIEPSDLGRVFEPFRRTEASRRTSIPGVGLGLMVTKRIVEAHGGRIMAESRPGAGSIFRVWLPRARPS